MLKYLIKVQFNWRMHSKQEFRVYILKLFQCVIVRHLTNMDDFVILSLINKLFNTATFKTAGAVLL